MTKSISQKLTSYEQCLNQFDDLLSIGKLKENFATKHHKLNKSIQEQAEKAVVAGQDLEVIQGCWLKAEELKTRLLELLTFHANQLTDNSKNLNDLDRLIRAQTVCNICFDHLSNTDENDLHDIKNQVEAVIRELVESQLEEVKNEIDAEELEKADLKDKPEVQHIQLDEMQMEKEISSENLFSEAESMELYNILYDIASLYAQLAGKSLPKEVQAMIDACNPEKQDGKTANEMIENYQALSEMIPYEAFENFSPVRFQSKMYDGDTMMRCEWFQENFLIPLKQMLEKRIATILSYKVPEELSMDAIEIQEIPVNAQPLAHQWMLVKNEDYLLDRAPYLIGVSSGKASVARINGENKLFYSVQVLGEPGFISVDPSRICSNIDFETAINFEQLLPKDRKDCLDNFFHDTKAAFEAVGCFFPLVVDAQECSVSQLLNQYVAVLDCSTDIHLPEDKLFHFESKTFAGKVEMSFGSFKLSILQPFQEEIKEYLDVIGLALMQRHKA
jgi:hypothetical protein